jgi:hypothetical protein
MKALNKAAVLSLLLIMAGVPGIARQLCAESSGWHGHACCMAHEQGNAAHCTAFSLAVSGSAGCCKLAPIESTAAQPILFSAFSNDRAYGQHATSDIAVALAAPALPLRQGIPLLMKLQHSPVQALLCTFLV